MLPVVEALVADFGPRFQKASIEVKVHAGRIPFCRADRGAFEQILSNLLSNAARYSNPGSRVDVMADNLLSNIARTEPSRRSDRAMERGTSQ